jgi:hypothetical protein
MAKRESKKSLRVKIVEGNDETEQAINSILTTQAAESDETEQAINSILPTQAAESDVSNSLLPTQTTEFNESFAKGRRLVFTRYNGQSFIHVREFITEGDRAYPTKTGICFTPARLKALYQRIESIDEELKEQNAIAENKGEKRETLYKTHLGAGICVSVNGKFNGVDLRRFWLPPGQISAVPTRRGIYIPASQWQTLKIKINKLMQAHPELANAEICHHQNQMELYDCAECVPFGLLYI